MDEHGQIRLDAGVGDWARDMKTVAHYRNAGEIVHLTYAAMASAHRLTIVPYSKIGAWVGRKEPGLGTGNYTLWVLQSHRPGAAWLLNGAYHDPSYLAERMQGTATNEADATALAILINSIEQATFGVDLTTEIQHLRDALGRA